MQQLLAVVALIGIGLATNISMGIPSAAAQCDPGGGTNGVEVTFANVGAVAVDVLWVNFQCGETLYTTVGPNREYNQRTFVSHLWRFKEVGTGNLVKEERIAGQTRIEFGTPSSTTTPVPGQAVPTPVAVPAPAADQSRAAYGVTGGIVSISATRRRRCRPDGPLITRPN